MKIRGGVLAAVIVSLFFLIVGVGIGVNAYISSRSCERQAAMHAAPYTWDLGVGCFVEIEPGKWVPADKL